MVKKIPLKEFKAIYRCVPRLCVEVILIRDGKILLIKRTISPAAGQWHVPGGTVLKGENLKEAVKRVAEEELGIKVNVTEKLIGVIEYTSFKNHYSQDISIAFRVESCEPKAFELDGHADEYDFFDAIPENTIQEQKQFLLEHFNLPLSRHPRR